MQPEFLHSRAECLSAAECIDAEPSKRSSSELVSPGPPVTWSKCRTIIAIGVHATIAWRRIAANRCKCNQRQLNPRRRKHDLTSRDMHLLEQLKKKWMLALCAPLDRQQFNKTFTGAFSAQSPKVSGDFSCGSLKIHSSMGFGPMVFQLGAFNPRSSELYNSVFSVLKAGYNDLPSHMIWCT
ncbi:hypothetical protein KL919_004692 [Ogataea angusta]|nr:hypothetical protein KL919_004692 [Ogataea angusta]